MEIKTDNMTENPNAPTPKNKRRTKKNSPLKPASRAVAENLWALRQNLERLKENARNNPSFFERLGTEGN